MKFREYIFKGKASFAAAIALIRRHVAASFPSTRRVPANTTRRAQRLRRKSLPLHVLGRGCVRRLKAWATMLRIFGDIMFFLKMLKKWPLSLFISGCRKMVYETSTW